MARTVRVIGACEGGGHLHCEVEEDGRVFKSVVTVEELLPAKDAAKPEKEPLTEEQAKALLVPVLRGVCAEAAVKDAGAIHTALLDREWQV